MTASDETNGSVTASVLLESVLQQYGREQSPPPAISTGFGFLDQAMGGWRTGLHLVAGSPGSGKSALALHSLRAAAAAGYPALYLGFEIEPDQIVMRLLCQHHGWDRRELLDGTMATEQLRAGGDILADDFSRIAIVPADPTLDVAAVEHLARDMMAKHGRGQCLIVIDYLQVWAAGTRQFSEFRHEIAKLTIALRRLALDLSSPVLAISSQNRNMQGEPTLPSLEGTSDLEYSADSVCFLIHVERPANQSGYLPPEEALRKSRTVSLNLRKNHFGETGSRVIKFMPQSGSFDEESLQRTGAA